MSGNYPDSGIQSSPFAGSARMGQAGVNSFPIPGKPLVRFTPAKEVERIKTETKPQELTLVQESALCGHIRRAWDRNKLFKQKVALRLLKCLRARRGVYSPGEIATLMEHGGLNFVWVDLTETKCRAASAWIREVLMPIGDRPWMIDPSPMPDLPQERKTSIVQEAMSHAQQAMIQQSQQGGGVMSREQFKAHAAEIGDQIKDEISKAYKKVASAAAERMSDRIEDEMLQGGWERAINDLIEDFVTYPAAVLEGPIYTRKRELGWGAGWKPVVDEKPRMSWRRVDIFDVFPSPYAIDCQAGDFIVRRRYTRRELFDCIGVEDYREDEIRKALEAYTGGHLESWLWTEAERQRLQQDTMYTWLAPSGIIDGLHYWGSVPGWKLLTWGVRLEEGEDIDPHNEYEVDAIIIGPYVVRCAINRDPLKRRPYWKACYDSVPGAFWGRSIPDLAETCQKMANAAACALADNMGMASGPMVWAHTDRFANGETSVDVFPWRVWQLKSDPTQGVNPGVGFFQPDNNADSLAKQIENWEIKADDATGIPRYTYGNERVAGAADTYSGLSMLMNNAAKGLRRAIGDLDVGVIEPTVYGTFVNLMIYDPDTSIKADCVIRARGAAAILVREAQSQARLQALQLTANPIDMQVLGVKGRAALLRNAFKALDLPVDDVVPTDEEIDQQQQAAQQAQQAAAQQALQQAQQQQQQQMDFQADQNQLDRIQKDAHEQKRLDTQRDIAVHQGNTAVRVARMKDKAKPKGLSYNYNDDGDIIGAQLQ